MMPGDSIYLSDQEDEQAESLEIKKILLPSRELVEFETDFRNSKGNSQTRDHSREELAFITRSFYGQAGQRYSYKLSFPKLSGLRENYGWQSIRT